MAYSHRFRRGFTLVELLVSIAIVAVLAGLALGVAAGVRRSTSEAKTKALMEKTELALQAYYQDRGYYPMQAAGEANFGDFRHTQTGQPYLEGFPEVSSSTSPLIDGWKRQFRYEYQSGDSHYRLWSQGADTVTEEDDICNWRKR